VGDTIVVGAGIFGVTAALELRSRGHAVRLLDPGPLPHPLAASTDISKIVRMEYGADRDYAVLGERSLEGWRRWNEDLGVTLFHESGVLFMRRTPLAPGTFEGESLRVLEALGHRLERIDRRTLAARYPAWNAELYADGTFDAEGGFVESGRVVGRLVAEARARGVSLEVGAFDRLLLRESRVTGVLTRDGSRHEAEHVVLALGAWTPHALPELARSLRSTGHPVFHLRPANPALFQAERFPVFGADISATGYYGFPLHPVAGVVKVARHGPGRVMHPEAPERAVTEAETADLRAFLRGSFPALADAPVVATRICLYSDTWDGHFWIARDPGREGLVVATGDSGHGFKFGPVLGAIVADAVEGKKNPLAEKFRWRPEVHPDRTEEAARFQGD
jgi:glycine/D-amino acid oxidase-like deaminating enzyme